jgi:hypothetical protein
VTSREWNTAVGTGLLRIVVGVVLLRWRRVLAARVAGADDNDRLVPLLFGYFGVRDITVGVLTLAATKPGSDVAAKVRLQGHADATDTLVVAAAVQTGHVPRARGTVAMVVAAGSAAAEYLTAHRLRRS